MINLDDKKKMNTLGFTEIPLFAWTRLELNIFLKMYETKSKINLLLILYLEYKTMILLSVDFIVSLT